MAKQHIENGMIFEYIVGIILKSIYPHIHFEHTYYSHDGGKDFYATNGGEKLWVEAKCHQRHLELSRIAGTFIMADIYEINQIIVFSASELSVGAIKNLSKYAAKHGKTMIVYQGSDITDLICSSEPLKLSEYIDTIPSERQAEAIQLINKTENLLQNSEFNNLLCNLEAITIKPLKASYLDFVLSVFAFCIFNYINTKTPMSKKRKVRIIDENYYLRTGDANPKELNHGVKAFQIFSNEIIFRNDDLKKSKSLAIRYELSTKYYRLVSKNYIHITLLPGQCFAATTYFKALNDAQNIVLPQPKISIDDTSIRDPYHAYQPLSIPCQVIGETPYLPPDGAKYNSCCVELIKKAVFTPIIVYGRSGVGKTRFLHEMQNKRIEDGNECFIFHGDNPCNSINDFLRYLLLSYYNLIFDTHTGQICLPNYSGENIPECYQFIFNLLNKGKLDVLTARNWLVSVLQRGGVTVLIDNAQMLDKSLYEFLLQVISDLQNHSCNSEVVLSFNTDFMLKESSAYAFFNYIKNSVLEQFKIEITGFDKDNAAQYLKQSLDPDGLRDDLDGLCKETIAKVGTNPLYLKQIIHYLTQKKVIGFQGETFCILNHQKLMEALSDLPATLHELITLRYNLLTDTFSSQKEQIADIFWSILLFQSVPEALLQKIDGIQPQTLRACISTGFIKFGENNCLVYDHQLIAKSLLVLLEEKAYTPKPEISKIGLRKSTSMTYLDSFSAYKFVIPRFVLMEKWLGVTEKDIEELLKNISFENMSVLLMPYLIGLIEKEISDYNKTLQPESKIDALSRMIRNCQDRLGVQRTKALFSDIIRFQIANFEINRSCTDSFLELLKFFMYELPPRDKDAFLEKMQSIGSSLLSGASNKAKRDDYNIWIKWATGKNRMHLYDFPRAKEFLNQGVQLAIKTENNHRLAELEVQLGYLAAYLGDKADARNHWHIAAENFSKKRLYDRILQIIFKANAQILGNDFSEIQDSMTELGFEYHKNECYTFLKASIEDFLSNVLILQSVNNGIYDATADAEIKTALKRFRTLTVTYDTQVYLRAIYKTLVYYKYLLENFSHLRSQDDVEKDKKLAYMLCEELLANYRWGESDFRFFLPVFKDIAGIAGDNKLAYSRMIEYVVPEWKDLFCKLSQQDAKIIFQQLQAPQGIFSDKQEKIHLFHYSYTW